MTSLNSTWDRQRLFTVWCFSRWILQLVVCLNAISFADENSGPLTQQAQFFPEKLQTNLGTYGLNLEDFHLGYSIGILKDGMPIGTYHEKRQPETLASSSLDGPDRVAETLTSTALKSIATAGSNHQSVVDTLAGLERGSHQSTWARTGLPPSPLTHAKDEGLGQTSPSTNTEISSGRGFGIGPSDPDVFSLDKCLPRALGLLKQKLQIKNSLVNKESNGGNSFAVRSGSNSFAVRKMLEVVEVKLQETRGAGGLSCGRSDPHLSFATPGSVDEEIKILTALSVRSGRERTLTLEVIELAFSTAVSREIRDLYREIWWGLSLAAVFSSTPLPTLAEFMEILKQPVTEVTQMSEGFAEANVKVVVHNQPDQGAAVMQRTFDLGQQFLKSKYETTK